MHDGSRAYGGGSNNANKSDVQPRIIKDKVSNQIKLEDTLLDYMEIIISLNVKLNKHIQTTKLDVQGLESKVGK
jgi:hypothetical protein